MAFIVQPRSFSNRRLYQARGVPGVASVSPVYFSLGQWKNPVSHEMRSIFVVGVEPADRTLALPEWRPSSRASRCRTRCCSTTPRGRSSVRSPSASARAPGRRRAEQPPGQVPACSPSGLLRHRRQRGHERDELPAHLPGPAARPDRARPGADRAGRGPAARPRRDPRGAASGRPRADPRRVHRQGARLLGREHADRLRVRLRRAGGPRGGRHHRLPDSSSPT